MRVSRVGNLQAAAYDDLVDQVALGDGDYLLVLFKSVRVFPAHPDIDAVDCASGRQEQEREQADSPETEGLEGVDYCVSQTVTPVMLSVRVALRTCIDGHYRVVSVKSAASINNTPNGAASFHGRPDITMDENV